MLAYSQQYLLIFGQLKYLLYNGELNIKKRIDETT